MDESALRKKSLQPKAVSVIHHIFGKTFCVKKVAFSFILRVIVCAKQPAQPCDT